MKTRTYTIVGGDVRNIKLGKLLEEHGNKVNYYGFNKIESKLNLNKLIELDSSIRESEIIIGPLPLTVDGKNFNTPFYENNILIDQVFKLMVEEQIFMGGQINKEIMELGRNYGITIVDFLKREDLAILNAIPTAEGAIQVAMEEMETTIHDSNTMILGFGRIGKILAKMLYGIGANVYVVVRKHEDIAWIKSLKYTPIYLDEINMHLKNMDLIFNTIPKLILKEELLNKIKIESLIVDLASRPGGVEFKKAEELGIKVIWALGLPGKVAPLTSSKFIMETINNIIQEMEG